MNKKFSTLVACLLAGSAFTTATAHDRLEYRDLYVGSGITTSTSVIKHIDGDRWYQLRTTLKYENGTTAYGCLIHVRNEQTGEVYLKVVPEVSAPLLSSLWRVEYDEADGQGGGKFSFVNKETNVKLSYDHTFSATPTSGSITAGNFVQEDCNTEWEWYNNNLQTNPFDQVAPYSYLDVDRSKVMVMKVAQGGLVYSYVDESSNVLDNHGVRAGVNALEIQPVVATQITLTPQDFNSMIDFNKASQKQYGEFKFYQPDGSVMKGNPIENMVSGGVMDPGQKYQASLDDISAIYDMAVRQLGNDKDIWGKLAEVNAARKDWEKAWNDQGQKSADYLYLNSLYQTEVLHNKQIEEEQKAAAAAITYDGIIKYAIKKAEIVIGAYDKFNKTPNYWKLKDPTEEAAVKELKLKVDIAISDFTKIKDVKDDNVAVLGKVLDLSLVSEYIGKYQVANSKHNDAYANVSARAELGITDKTVSLYDKAVAAETELQQSSASVEAILAKVNTAKNELQTATAAVRSAREAWDAAEKALGSTVGSIHDKTKYILDEGYMRLKLMEDAGADVSDKNKYLMVDTAFWQTNQAPAASHLKIAHKTPKATDEAAIAARYFFKLTYFPTQDSIVVEPLNASKISQADYNASRYWKDTYAGNWFVYQNDVDGNAAAVSNTHTTGATFGPIVLKLDELNTSDLCLTAGAANREIDSYLKTRIAFNNPYDYLERTTLSEGLYFIKSTENGKYVVANMEGKFQYDVPESGVQDYLDMPATMFVVKKAGCENGSRVAIFNREYGKDYAPAFVGQLYKDEQGIYIINKRDYRENTLSWLPTAMSGRVNRLATLDHYSFNAITEGDAVTSKNHGYQYLDPETLKYTEYAINYNWSLSNNLFLNVAGDQFVTLTEGANTYYELSTEYPLNTNEVVPVQEFGYGAEIAGLPQLERQAYTLKVRDANLIDNDTTFVALVEENGQNEYYKAMGISDIRAGKGIMAQFYLKADQNVDGTKYYVLVDVRSNSQYPLYANGVRQLNCVDPNGKVSHVDLDNEPNERASTFALTVSDRPLYKTIEAAQNVNIFRTIGSTKQYLFEDGGNKIGVPNAKEGFGFLGLTQEDIKPAAGFTTALHVDEVVSSNARMPQYMFVVQNDSIADGYWCVSGTHGYFASKEEADAQDKNHYVYYNGYLAGRFLVNLTDSITNGTNLETDADMYKYQSFTRLGFVEGVHMNITEAEAEAMFEDKTKAGEYFFTLVGDTKLADLKNEQGYIIPEKLFDANLAKANLIAAGKHNNYSFSLRLKNDNEEGFYLESNKEGVSSIGSFKGAWVKEMNGVLVLAQSDTDNGDHNQNSGSIQEIVNQAQYFQMETTDEVATENEAINASEVSVIATDGAVIVKGAEGKTVVINNVLGQQIANTVVTSSEATIAAPAGVVVVAVEGEAAVKAIVK